MNGPINAQNIVLAMSLLATELIYIVLPISKARAERKIIGYFLFFFI